MVVLFVNICVYVNLFANVCLSVYMSFCLCVCTYWYIHISKNEIFLHFSLNINFTILHVLFTPSFRSPRLPFFHHSPCNITVASIYRERPALLSLVNRATFKLDKRNVKGMTFGDIHQ